jgi:flagellar hook-associated protein 3 FlgL
MSITGFPGFDRAAVTAATLRLRLADLTRQTASGQRADSYAGLGTDARRAIDLRAELQRREGLASSAARGEAFAEAGQLVLDRLGKVAIDMVGRANGMLGVDSANVPALAQTARNALKQVVGLLGERFEGAALFGGTDLEGSPIVAPDAFESTGFFTRIRDAVQGLTATGGQAVLEATLAVAKSDDAAVSPFSAHGNAAAQGLVEDPRRAVPVEDGVKVEIGLYANRNAAMAPGAEATGSWARDLLHGLSVLANLGPGQAAQGEGFRTLVQGAITSLRSGLSGVTEEASALGGAQERLASARTLNAEMAGQVEAQLGQVEQVDIAEAITRLQATQLQLQASYSSLAMLGDLSLTQFLR